MIYKITIKENAVIEYTAYTHSKGEAIKQVELAKDDGYQADFIKVT